MIDGLLFCLYMKEMVLFLFKHDKNCSHRNTGFNQGKESLSDIHSKCIKNGHEVPIILVSSYCPSVLHENFNCSL